MSTFTVWKFSEANGADNALTTLGQLQKQGLIKVTDGAVVSWPSDAKKPKTRQMRGTAGKGALSGSFWGLLFGLLFFIPLIGVAIGAAAGALAGSLSDVGIDDDFIRDVRAKVTPGTSALFLMTEDAVLDRVLPEVEHMQAELMFTNLSTEQENKLRAAFAED